MTVVIGLTGGIGSGKSTVAAMLAKLGALVIDADAIVHELQAPGSPMVRAIAEAFGPELVDERGALDRQAVAERVFADPAARKKLTDIVHPPTIAEMEGRLAEARAAGLELVVLDIPLLFEGKKAATSSGSRFPLEAIVLAYVPEELQIERAAARDEASRKEVEARVRAQLSIEEKRAMADYVIDNSGSIEETERQVRELYAELTHSIRP
jgi:dephospho-CoA kinase